MKKTNKAIALKYDANSQQAPIVTAKGNGEVANKIIEAANEHGVPIKEDRALVQLLDELEVNDQIPIELYPIIAEILAFIYRAEKKAGEFSNDKSS